MPGSKAGDWSWKFFSSKDEGVTCTWVKEGGGVCGHFLSTRNASNMKQHLLKAHGATADHERVRDNDLRQQKLPLAKRVTEAQAECLAVAESLLPFSVVERPWFRRAFRPTTLSSETLRKNTLLLAEEVLAAGLSQYGDVPVSLAVDSGTVVSRYLCVVIATRPTALLSMVQDTIFEDNSLTQ